MQNKNLSKTFKKVESKVTGACDRIESKVLKLSNKLEKEIKQNG